MAAPEALAEAESVPQVAPLQPGPDRVHFTPRFCESLVTVAVKDCCCEACTLAGVGATLTEIGAGAVMVICAEAVFAGLGTVKGAV